MVRYSLTQFNHDGTIATKKAVDGHHGAKLEESTEEFWRYSINGIIRVFIYRDHQGISISANLEDSGLTQLVEQLQRTSRAAEARRDGKLINNLT